MKDAIHTKEAPAALGPYSQAIQVGHTVYFAGQIALDPHTNVLIADDIQTQTRMVLNHLQTLSQVAGGSIDDIVKLTVYLIDLQHIVIVNEMIQMFFQQPYPARATVQVSALPKGALIEMDAIMYLPNYQIKR